MSAMPSASRSGPRVVFLLDVDNTLLDNDRVIADMRAALAREIGEEKESRYWSIFEQCRAELGYADYLWALQRSRLEYPHDPNVLAISTMLVNYPFGERLFPGALDVVRHLDKWGTTVILTDGETSGEQTCRQLADQAAEKKIRFNIIGVGTDWNQNEPVTKIRVAASAYRPAPRTAASG